MRYLSVCSGIEAATAAWHPLGWHPVGFAEVDKFPSAVLNFHYPDVPNFGDMTKFEEWPDANVDVLVGGTPCQSFSVAGLRGGLDDARGNLMLVYAAIAQRYRPAWVAWENVPGVLSDDGGRGFASLLGLLAGRRVEVPSGGWESAGVVEGYKGAYGLAWRVLDAQFVRVDGFGWAVPQRRRRVFVVGYLGDWRRAAAVLFEPESLRGDPPPRREAGQVAAGTIRASAARRGGVQDEADASCLIADVAPTLSESSGHARPGDNIQSVGYLLPEVANPLTARMFKGVNTTMDEGQTMVGVLVFDETQITHPENRSRPQPGAPSHALAGGARPPTIAFDCKAAGKNVGFAVGDVPSALVGAGHGGGRSAVAFQPRFARNDRGAPSEVAYPLTAEAGRTGKGDSAQCVAAGWVVRRLTPTECERLQGFPDGFTNIPWRGKNGSPDGPRYKALGNSMATNVMRWLGRRIQMVEAIK